MTTATATASAAHIAANGAVYRTFTREESSAIQNLHIEEEGYVEVIFHSNTERAYGFDSNPLFCEVLTEIISAPNLDPYGLKVSLGALIAQNRKNGNLVVIEEAAE
jgi:hypothetical protein